jgi:signal transduction histidine kinase
MGGVVLYYMITPSTKDELQSVLQKSQLSLAQYIADNIDKEIHKRESLIHALSQRVPHDIISDTNRLQKWLDKQEYMISTFKYGIVVVSPDGKKVLAQTPLIKGRANIDYSVRGWFNKAVKSDDMVISPPFMGLASKKPMINIATSIKDKNGKTIAVVYGASDLSKGGFMDFVYKNSIGNSGGFLIISPKDELFVASSKPKMVLKKTPPKGVNLLHDKVMAGYRGTGITENAFGVVELSAIASIHTTGWFIVVRMPVDEAFLPIQRLNEEMRDIIIPFLTLFTIIFVSMMLYLLRPLKHSAYHINEMATGKEPLKRIEVSDRGEVGYMVNGFNSLVSRVQKDMQTQQKMASMGEMISIIAHQWKQPLSVISSIGSSIRMKNTLGTLESEYLEDGLKDISSQVNFMVETMDEFRHFFNPNKAKKLEDLNRVINSATSLIGPELQNQKIKLIEDINLPTKVNTLSNELIQVLLNLMKNAKEQYNENQDDRVLQLIGYEDDSHSYIIVKDNAGGIPDDVIGKIFDKYFSTKGEKKGTGLGLDLCKTIIEDNCNGKITVQNSDGGAMFSIALPKA